MPLTAFRCEVCKTGVRCAFTSNVVGLVGTLDAKLLIEVTANCPHCKELVFWHAFVVPIASGTDRLGGDETWKEYVVYKTYEATEPLSVCSECDGAGHVITEPEPMLPHGEEIPCPECGGEGVESD